MFGCILITMCKSECSVVLRSGCLFTILLVLLKREECQNYSSISFALIELSQLI